MSTRWQASSRAVHPDDKGRINQSTSGDSSAIVQADTASRTVWLPKGSNLLIGCCAGRGDALSRVTWTNLRTRQSGYPQQTSSASVYP